MKRLSFLGIGILFIIVSFNLSAFYKNKKRSINIKNQTGQDIELYFYTNTGGHPALLTKTPYITIRANNKDINKIDLQGDIQNSTAFIARIHSIKPSVLDISNVVANENEIILPYAKAMIVSGKNYLIVYDELIPNKIRID